MPTELRITDQPLLNRIERASERRHDATITKTARDLLHERLMELEANGDPAAAQPSESTHPAPTGT